MQIYGWCDHELHRNRLLDGDCYIRLGGGLRRPAGGLRAPAPVSAHEGARSGSEHELYPGGTEKTFERLRCEH